MDEVLKKGTRVRFGEFEGKVVDRIEIFGQLRYLVEPLTKSYFVDYVLISPEQIQLAEEVC